MEKKNSESSHVPLQSHDIKSITESGTIGSSVVSEKYWTATAAEILNSKALPYHELWTIDSFTGSNEIYLFCLKVIGIAVKGVSKIGMVIDSLFCIKECNRCCL